MSRFLQILTRMTCWELCFSNHIKTCDLRWEENVQLMASDPGEGMTLPQIHFKNPTGINPVNPDVGIRTCNCFDL